MQSRLLRHFLAVVEHKNMTAAAQSLGVSQPTLTRSIGRLEQSLGVELFDRLPTGVTVTRQGEVLARRAKLMQLEYRLALSEIAAIDEGLAGVLRIAAGPMWLMTLLPTAVTAFHAEFPNIHVRLNEGVIETMVEGLLTGEIDIVCTTLNFPGHAEVVKEPLLGIRHVVYARKDHALAGRALVRPHELLDYDWVALANDSVGTGRIGAFFVANNLPPPRIAVETCAMGMLNLMAAGDFLGLMPAAAAEYVGRLGLQPIYHEGSFWDSQSGIAYLRSPRPAPIVNTFRAFLRSSIAPGAGGNQART